MGTYNILDKSLIVHNNKPSPLIYEWKKEFNKVHDLIANILKDKPWIIYNNDVFFQVVYLYENIPSKTNRINFRDNKNIKNILDIPQKDIFIQKQKDGLIKTVLTYKITIEELNKFIDEIKKIYELKYSLTSDNFINATSNYQKLIKNLSQIYYISKIKLTKIEKTKGKILVSFIPLYDNLTEFIQTETNVKINYDSIIKGAYISYEELEIILSKIPWIIKNILNIEDLSLKLPTEIKESFNETVITLNTQVKSLPIVGVIDSGCNLKGDFINYIDNIYDYKEEGALSDYSHGSQVSSLIIANDELNPSHLDGLGNFKIRHFEILGKSPITGETTCSFEHLTKSLLEIISTNKDIKVWNLSLGCIKKPWTLNISKLGIFIDYLSSKYDCLFVIASGNDKENCENELESLNSPADSLNALAVGSVYTHEKNEKVFSSNYSSIGNISHFIKPEVSTFGGPLNFDKSAMTTFLGESPILFSKGTSFSSPRIARIAAFLIKDNYSVLEAKAKIINLANRETPMIKSSAFGYILPNKEEFELDLKVTTTLNDISPRYIDLNLKNVDKISIAVCNFVNPAPFLGEEYSLTNVEISLIKYPINWEKMKRTDKKGVIFDVTTPEWIKKSVDSKHGKQKNDESLYKKENIRRLEDGKYFPSHKVTYNLLKDNLEVGWTYAVRIRRLNLYDLSDPQPLKIGVSIKLMGKNINENEFLKSNDQILDIEQDIEIDI